MSGNFADSNVLLYLLSEDAHKRLLARRVLADDLIVSVQVLNEIVNVARRKHRMDWGEIDEFISDLMPVIDVRPLTIETHKAARRLAARYGFAFYDCLIVASAVAAGCTTLFTEDLQHAQKIGDLTLVNPFR